MKNNISFSVEDLRSRISEDRDFMVGAKRPVIRNKHFAVSQILEFLLHGMSIEDILKTYPVLEHEDVLAALYHAWQKSDEWDPVPAAS